MNVSAPNCGSTVVVLSLEKYNIDILVLRKTRTAARATSWKTPEVQLLLEGKLTAATRAPRGRL